MIRGLWKSFRRSGGSGRTTTAKNRNDSSGNKENEECCYPRTAGSNTGATKLLWIKKNHRSKNSNNNGESSWMGGNNSNLAKTPFPDFHPDELATVASTEVSDTSTVGEHHNEHDVDHKTDGGDKQQHQQQYRSKEDEDVDVFLNLANSMSLQSLLHLLRGMARAQQQSDLPPTYLHQYAQLAAAAEQQEEPKGCPPTEKKPVLSKQKQFRFAEVSNCQVRAVVHEIDSLLLEDDDTKSKLWWSEEETQSFRQNAIQIVNYYCRYRSDYIQSVEALARAPPPRDNHHGDTNNVVVEKHMKRLLEPAHAQVRGLESHIAHSVFSCQRRRGIVHAILQEQDDCRAAAADYATTCDFLRDQSEAHSAVYRRFAIQIAGCDHVDALRASISSW